MDTKLTPHERITKLLDERIHIQVPSYDTDLMESGLLDSLSLVELIAALEETFDIQIPFEDIELDNFRSVNTIAGFTVSRSSTVSSFKFQVSS